jgi:Viral BACON domain
MRLFSWISILVLISLLMGGVFGLAVSLGRGFLSLSAQSDKVFALQVTPSTVASGGIVTLHGSGFSPSGRIGLTRDTNITLVDTGGTHIIYADTQGSFSDTVFVDPKWGASSHMIRAEDAATHKSASFTVSVTGQGASLHPSHLLLSMNAIDLGSGDQATNSTQIITLSNDGGGQITWQATATQPWLMVSPKSGTVSYGQNMKVAVAVDRSNLQVGAYTDSLFFSSNTGPVTLPIKMVVSALQPGHEAVLQLTPAVLSFTGADGGSNPLAQAVTISNPGVLPLQWNATSSTNDGSSWLSMNTLSGTVTKGGSQAVTIGVNSSTLLPGVYSGLLTFSGKGTIPAKHSPQTIFVSLVITQQCSLQISPAGLTFAGAYLQASPAQKVITIGDSQSCSTPLAWSATVTTSSGGQWLSIGQTRGVAPASPAIHVISTGLKPGTYNGSINFNWAGGTQNLPITYIVGQAATPIIAATPATMAFSGIIGQATILTQTATITNTGGGTLVWHASAVTAIGGNWLGITTVTGAIDRNQSTLISVTATPLRTLTTGTYTGTITITGTDKLGNPANGSPLSIPVNFVVQAPCSVTSTPPALNFQGVAGGAKPVAQSVTIAASGACVHALDWTAKAAGGAWLTGTPAGTVSVSAPAVSSVGVALTGLAAGKYTGSVTLTAIDSVTKLAVGAPRVIAVTLIVQPACTLQTPTATAVTFSTEANLNPATQTFTVGVTGSCAGNVTITPSIANGNGWLTVSPSSATVISGGRVPFTVAVKPAGLAAGKYTASISLAAANGSGQISGNGQVVGITFYVSAPPALAAGTGTATNNVSSGTISQPVMITNNGGSALNWTAALITGAPGYFSLPTTSGTNLVGGTTASISVLVDTTGLPGGTTVTTHVIISAIDPLTGQPVARSPVTVPITINIPPPPPKIVLSANTLTFTTTAGNNPTAQTINVQNGGGNTLTWTVGTPSMSWLTVTPAADSDTAGQSTPLTFNVKITGLSLKAGTYLASVVITPSVGASITVNVSLTIN